MSTASLAHLHAGAERLVGSLGMATHDLHLVPHETHGYVNELFDLTGPDGRWLLKQYRWPWPSEPPTDRAGVELSVTKWAAATGLPVGRILAAERSLALIEVVDGAPLGDSTAWRTADLAPLGAGLRRWHCASPPSDVLAAVADRPTWDAWMRTARDRVLSIIDDRRAARKVAALFEGLADARPGSLAIIHHDLHPWNVLSGGDGTIRVIDWEMARRGDPHWDLATFCVLWRDPIDPSPLSGFLRGYGDESFDHDRLVAMAAAVGLWMVGESAAGDSSAPEAACFGRAVLARIRSQTIADAVLEYRPDLARERHDLHAEAGPK